jgi:RNA-directed DNA polymerase
MIKSKGHLTSLLHLPWSELLRMTQNIDRYYYKKPVPKLNKDGIIRCDKNGNPIVRILYPSVNELKKLQKLINKAILSKIPLSPCVYGGVKGKDNIKNGKAHLGRKNKFVTDIKDFYPSVSSKMVYTALIKHGFSADVASILTKLTTYKNQIPQGAPTSTHIANIALAELDQDISFLAIKHQICYTRFVDDMSFSSQSEFKVHSYDFIRIIKKHQLQLSHKKTGYASGSIPITGTRVRNNNLDISDELKLKLNNPDQYSEKQIIGQHNYAKRVRGCKYP